ncbi:MAG: hypothetical protein WCQ48_05435 [Chloroflexota bacterium]
MLDEQLEQECAEWVAEMISDQFDAFVPSMFCAMVFMTEDGVREDNSDPQMDHATMTDRIITIFEADPDMHAKENPDLPNLVFEILHWEDQFRCMAGEDRHLRPPVGTR